METPSLSIVPGSTRSGSRSLCQSRYSGRWPHSWDQRSPFVVATPRRRRKTRMNVTKSNRRVVSSGELSFRTSVRKKRMMNKYPKTIPSYSSVLDSIVLVDTAVSLKKISIGVSPSTTSIPAIWVDLMLPVIIRQVMPCTLFKRFRLYLSLTHATEP